MVCSLDSPAFSRLKEKPATFRADTFLQRRLSQEVCAEYSALGSFLSILRRKAEFGASESLWLRPLRKPHSRGAGVACPKQTTTLKPQQTVNTSSLSTPISKPYPQKCSNPTPWSASQRKLSPPAFPQDSQTVGPLDRRRAFLGPRHSSCGGRLPA